MAEDNWLNRDWKDRSFIDKASVVASGGTGMLAREGFKMWQGDTNRLDDIKAQAAELENSPYNTATVTQQNQDYYSKVMADYAKAKREAEFGFTPEQTAAAKQTFAETTNLGAQNAMNAGGGTIAKYINANLNSNQNKFATGLAEADANLKMQKQQQVLNYLSQVGNASGISQDVFTQNFNKQIMEDQAIGQAEKDWYAQRDINRKGVIDAGAAFAGQAIGIGAKAAGF